MKHNALPGTSTKMHNQQPMPAVLRVHSLRNLSHRSFSTSPNCLLAALGTHHSRRLAGTLARAQPQEAATYNKMDAAKFQTLTSFINSHAASKPRLDRGSATVGCDLQQDMVLLFSAVQTATKVTCLCGQSGDGSIWTIFSPRADAVLIERGWMRVEVAPLIFVRCVWFISCWQQTSPFCKC